MWTTLWENVEQETIDALTITGKGDFKILPKDQMEAIYKYRLFAYEDDTLRNRFHIILQDNMHIICALKKMKTWLEQLINHVNWAKVEKIVQNSDSAGLSSTVGSTTSTGNDKNMYLGYTKGNNKIDNKQKIKGGSTDSNSYGDDVSNREWLEVNENPDEEEKYATMRSYNASNQIDKNEINDIGLQLNSLASNMNATATSNSTGLSKNINKTDNIKLNFNTAQDLISIINIKIPEFRKIFYSKFDVLFVAIY